jgi:hypothetical protein
VTVTAAANFDGVASGLVSYRVGLGLRAAGVVVARGSFTQA